jgi:hypothetical protein
MGGTRDRPFTPRREQPVTTSSAFVMARGSRASAWCRHERTDAEIYFVELDNVETGNLEGFHPLCKNLKSIHFYGSKDKPSKWYSER